MIELREPTRDEIDFIRRFNRAAAPSPFRVKSGYWQQPGEDGTDLQLIRSLPNGASFALLVCLGTNGYLGSSLVCAWALG